MIDSYIISLKNETEPESQKLIKNIKDLDADLNPVWFNGINGKTTDLQPYKHHFDPFFFNTLTPSTIGCALSHLYVWKQIASSEKEYSVVFEDDVVFTENFKSGLENCLKNAPEDFDVLMLGYLDASNPVLYLIHSILNHLKYNVMKEVNDYIIKPQCFFQTHAYVVSKNGAKRLIELIDGYIYQHIDFTINSFYLKDQLKIYAVKDRIAFQTSFVENSTNVSSKYPIVLNNLISTIYLDVGLPLSYVANVDAISLGFLNVNLIMIVTLFLGIILSILNVDILYTTLAVVLFSIPDIKHILTKGDVEHLKKFIYLYIVLILPSLIKISWKKLKKSN